MNESPRYELLDNPIWHALTTTQAGLAVGDGQARRFPARIGPLSGLKEPTAAAYRDLAAIVPDGDVATLFLDAKPHLPEGWSLLHGALLVQMVCDVVPDAIGRSDAIVALGPADYAEMLALATLTEPGPFREGTAELGGFLGIRVEGQLVAMAGQRLSPAGFTEVSAVCTDPAFRGHGYAKTLVGAVARQIQAAGRVAFLTSLAANPAAIRAYQQAGFSTRREFALAVLKPPASAI